MFKSGLRETRYGRLCVHTAFYLPHYLFKVVVQNGGLPQEQYLALDAMTGELDLRKFDRPPGEDEFDEAESDQFGATYLSEVEALSILKERVERMVYQRGFFSIKNLSVTGALVDRFYVPYRVACFVRNGRARLEVIDAVRGQFEGAKLRDLVEDWFGETAHQKNDKRRAG